MGALSVRAAATAAAFMQTSLSGALDTIAAAVQQLVCAEHVVSCAPCLHTALCYCRECHANS
jgi:hypothetical protein